MGSLQAVEIRRAAGTNIAMLAGMKCETSTPAPEELRRNPPWCWVVCECCAAQRRRGACAGVSVLVSTELPH
jgi:hypothetical protein